MFRSVWFAMCAAALALAVDPAAATVNVFACEPEWGALASEIGGARVNVFNATTAMQNVHKIQARPSLIARARSADLVICTGAELEIGWLPLVINSAGNNNVAVGRPGYLEAANFVTLIDVPTQLDRSLGDLHPRGNPHLHWNPHNIALVATELRQRLARIDPSGAGEYLKRHEDFARRWSEATARWQKLGAPLRGVGVIEHHRSLTYLFNWLGMPVLGSLEPKPGVEPTSAHLTELVEMQESHPARLIVRTGVNNPEASHWLAQRTGLREVELPASVGGSPGAKDLFGMYDEALRLLLGNGR